MKTVTLYTEEEFKERWPEYRSATMCIRKRSHWVGVPNLMPCPGWETFSDFEAEKQLYPISTLDYFKQQVIDITGAIAHIEAHPEEEGLTG